MSKTNESLLKRRQAAVPRGVGQIHPVVAERAENSTVWDVEGREYIDFAGGIAVLNTGHLHPKVIAAVQEQLGKLSHTCFQVLAYEPYIELAEEIAKRVPGDFPKKTLLVTSGSEAVENAVKIARAATGRAGVIAFTGAYHGRTMMTLGLTGKVVPYSAGMGLMRMGLMHAGAAALAVLKVFEEEKLLERSQAVGERLKAGLREIQAKHKVIGDVRGLGSMVAIELFEGGDTHKPAAELVSKIVVRAREKGLILLSCGTYYNVIRFLMPVTIPDAQLEKGLAILAECFDELA